MFFFGFAGGLNQMEDSLVPGTRPLPPDDDSDDDEADLEAAELSTGSGDLGIGRARGGWSVAGRSPLAPP